MNIPYIWNFRPLVVQRFIGGFTLTELVTVLVIAGVLAAMAGPAMVTFIHSNRLSTTTNDFIGALNVARSEAMKRGVNAGVCKSEDGSTCTAAGTWESGWIVFLDGDNNGPWTASDSMIRTHEGLPAGIGVTVVNGADAIVYSRQGLVPAASPNDYAYTVCSSETGQSRTIRIGFAGRASLSEGTC